MPRAASALRRTALPPLCALAAACAGAGPPEEPAPPPPEGWRVGAAEHLGLWYHGLAYTLVPAGQVDTAVVPRYDGAYVDSIVAYKRRTGAYPTPLDRRAGEFTARLREEAFRGLEFVPLYFRSADALFAGIDLWAEAGGEPGRAGSAEGARIVRFLSSLFPTAAQRRTVIEWVALLREERTAFYTGYWAERAPALEARAAAVQREWDALAPALRDYLDYVQLENGELFLVPALGVEGRLATGGFPAARAAIGVPPADRPEDAAHAFAHELVYPVAREAVRDYVAPARIRELGEQRLLTLAAVRGGAFLLEDAAPARVEPYERLFLEATGRAAPGRREALDAAFRDAFPLPDGLEQGLREMIRRALAGI